MMRKIIGALLVIVAIAVAVVLLVGHGPILPHILGPIVLATVGILLLAVNCKVDHSVEQRQ